MGNATGIIPANTGKIFTVTAIKSRSPDHPREYGENHKGALTQQIDTGSSPRIRGKLLRDAGSNSGVGIIPANTGKMVWAYSRLSLARDHPREYGENRTPHPSSQAFQGSSPRIRGKYCCFR